MVSHPQSTARGGAQPCHIRPFPPANVTRSMSQEASVVTVLADSALRAAMGWSLGEERPPRGGRPVRSLVVARGGIPMISPITRHIQYNHRMSNGQPAPPPPE